MTPAQYPEYAALRGDPSDNLPGVPGVGEKTAAKLITTYGGLDGIFAHVDDQSPKLRASLAEHEERVRKNHEVMVLRRDAPIDLPESLKMDPNMAEVQRLFDFLEFRTFTERLVEALGPAAAVLADEDRVHLVAEITHQRVTRCQRSCSALARRPRGRRFLGRRARARRAARLRCRDGCRLCRGDVGASRPPR